MSDHTIELLLQAGVGTLALLILGLGIMFAIMERRNDRRRIELEAAHEQLKIQLSGANETLRLEIEKASAENQKASQSANLVTAENTKRLIEAQIQSQLDHITTVHAIEENNASRRARLEIEAKQAEILQMLVQAQNDLRKDTLDNLDKAVGVITGFVQDRNEAIDAAFLSIRKDITAHAQAANDLEDVAARLDQAGLPAAISAMTAMMKDLPEQMKTQLKEEMQKFHEELQTVTAHFQKLLDILNTEAPPPAPKPEVNVTVNNVQPIPAGNGNGDSPNV